VAGATLVERYLELGLELGKHVDGLVDAYYGPAELRSRIASTPVRSPGALAADARALVAELDGGGGEPDLDPVRRRWVRAQLVGLETTAEKQDGIDIAYLDEVERCYGVRPHFLAEDEFEGAHRRLDTVVPGVGSLRERYIAWRETQAVPVDKLDPAIHSLADDFRERTQQLFGLPAGEHVEWQLETNKPWAGFNYYLGGLRSRVAINTDLPVLSTSLGHLVAHEAYPGHHTEHTRKEAGLVRRLGHLEETIFLVGTPQCLLAEGLADLGIEVLLGPEPEPLVEQHLRPLGVPYDAEIVAAVRDVGEILGAVRGNAAWMLHQDGASVDDVVTYLERWSLLPRPRAQKAVEFLTDPTWRAYISCYIEGLPLCRDFVAGDARRFERLLTEQLVPEDLLAA
jgi:hypothetical protein